MKTKITYILVTFITVTVLGNGAAFAQNPFALKHDKSVEINLTEDQKSKLESGRLALRKQMIRFRADLAAANLEKSAMMKDKAFTKAAVQEQIKKIMAIKTDMQMAKLDNHDLIRRVLTDDQWKPFIEMLSKNTDRKMMKKHLGKGQRNKDIQRAFSSES